MKADRAHACEWSPKDVREIRVVDVDVNAQAVSDAALPSMRETDDGRGNR
jgi:hypothetical protein